MEMDVNTHYLDTAIGAAKHRELKRLLAARKQRELDRAARFAKPPEPVQMCAVEGVPAAVSPWIVPGIVAYLLTLAGSALLSMYWASPAVRGFVEMLRAQP